jgi:hypothetical protein
MHRKVDKSRSIQGSSNIKYATTANIFGTCTSVCSEFASPPENANHDQPQDPQRVVAWRGAGQYATSGSARSTRNSGVISRSPSSLKTAYQRLNNQMPTVYKDNSINLNGKE